MIKFILLLFIITIVPFSGFAESDSVGNVIRHEFGASDAEKTEITCSGALEVDYEDNVITFNDDVLVKDSQMSMKADKVDVFFDPENKRIKKIIATGRVKFKKDERQAKAEKAEYFAEEGKVVLSGNPMVKRGMDVLTGDKITFFKKDNRMLCEPSAKLLIYTEGDTAQEGEWW